MYNVPKDLEVLPLGENGEMEIVPSSADNIPCSSRLPCGLPPILPDTETLLKSYLNDMDKLPIFDLDNVQRFIRRAPDIHSLFPIDICPLQTTLKVKRDMTTGRLLGFSEEVKDILEETTKTSTSLKRAPGPPEAGVKGSNSGFPFWPGGMDDPLEKIIQKEPIATSLFEGEYLSTPPGFKNGMTFERKDHGTLVSEAIPPQKIYLTDILSLEEPINLEPFKETENPFNMDEIKLEELHIKSDKKPEVSEADDDILKIDELPVLNISKMNEEKINKPNIHYEWAVEEDVTKPIEDFHSKIPDMAYKWPFELDTFQKRAVLHLENHESVFVAAHTSAGKTVVAEYAIALAKKHMTRVIYTSPIKALSNQKFRDFKIAFEDVGLITGDIQINQTAFCLIMTTEILRSMLYHGSDVVRELEWVIFDEVHYINDAERGVVWEEVLIMLPSHVNLILLSATVPNTAEFAEWLGRIKKRKIYVISTLKRPVPLEFFLYTGSVGKTQDNRFLLVDATGKFLTTGYNKAVDSKKEGKDGKTKKMTGPKGPRSNVTPQQEKNIYIGIIGHLKKEDLLPVVCFTLSRKKCDDHARMLQSKDLCTQKEKNEIVAFVNRSISKLKETDRDLPQVKSMREMLSCGYGVHHSGILPILKEIVEMLFQKGLVKVLFATETFAMGVNMPARTVVFDSIRKHDGVSFRDLMPSEYIQMAGRAGRRGLDKTGTVVILCKGDIPEMGDLHRMMLGKPQKLESKFRLTYTMILNLLKVRSFRVQDVMKRSFGESSSQKEHKKHQDMLNQAQDKLSNLSKPACSLCSSDLDQYYETIYQLEEHQRKIVPKLCVHALNTKILTPGRIVTVRTESHKNVPGVFLSVDKENYCKVLLISTKQQGEGALKNQDNNMQVKSVDSSEETGWGKSIFFTSENRPEICTITFEDFQMIANKTLRVDVDKILKDWSKMRSYVNMPPGQFISAAFQELCSYCETRRDGLPSANINVKDMQLMDDMRHFEHLESSMGGFQCVQCPLFKEHFSQMHVLMKAQDDVNKYEYLVSEESLLLHSDYKNRKEVLKNLKYIDAADTPTLKGSVAREMNNHELLTTELLLKNVFGGSSPEEIASVLSCMVFQQRCDESNLTFPDNLMKKVEQVKQTAEEINEEQKYCEIYEPDFVEQYRFYLVNVVYEWAKGTSFSEIMKHTDVQEGIIVRCIQRLSELLKDVKNGAQLVGDPTLAKKMEDASRLIKRDIVFAASLYTQ